MEIDDDLAETLTPVATAAAAAAASDLLIPGLTDDIAAVILALLPFPHQSRLRITSRRWRRLLSPAFLLPFRLRLRLPRRHLLCLFPADPAVTHPLLFDPGTAAWAPLPPTPCSPHLYGLSNFVPVALGPHLYLLGGSHFDARAYPLGHPAASAAAYRLDLARPPGAACWVHLPDMTNPRGSFACAAIPPPTSSRGMESGSIVVAGGGSRHPLFPSDGSRMNFVELYDITANRWVPVEGMPRLRAGCVGFVVKGSGDCEDEFFVMGGYGDYRTLSGVVPSDDYCRDAFALGLRSGKWREVGNMWEEGERPRLGKVAVVDAEDGTAKGVYMLDRSDIFRYDVAMNRWMKESTLARKIKHGESCGFAAMNGELFVLTTTTSTSRIPSDPQRPAKKRLALDIQVYNPERKDWKTFTTNPRMNHSTDFRTAVLCTIRL